MGRNKTRQQNIKHMKNNKLNPKQSTFASIEYTKQTGEVCKMQVILGVSYPNAVKRSLNELNGQGEYAGYFGKEATIRTIGAIKAKAAKGLLAKPETVALNDETDLLIQATELVTKAIVDTKAKLESPSKPRKESETGNVLFPCIVRNSKVVKKGKGEPRKESKSAAQSIANNVVRGMLPHGQWKTLIQGDGTGTVGEDAGVSQLNGKPFAA